MLIPDRSEAEERAARALLDGSYRAGDRSPDRIPHELLSLPLAEALEIVADWLDDGDNHVALRRPGGLPTPPFSPEQACVIVRIAALYASADKGWRPISTAHRDGRDLLLSASGFKPCMGLWFKHPEIAPQGVWMSFDPEGRFSSDAELAAYLAATTYEPTHWQPAPARHLAEG